MGIFFSLETDLLRLEDVLSQVGAPFQALNLVVVGSSPTVGAKLFMPNSDQAELSWGLTANEDAASNNKEC